MEVFVHLIVVNCFFVFLWLLVLYFVVDYDFEHSEGPFRKLALCRPPNVFLLLLRTVGLHKQSMFYL